MTTSGVFLFALSSIAKYMLDKTEKDIYRRILFALKLNFSKEDMFSGLSALQLLGVLWIGFEYFESLISAHTKNIPDTLMFALELFLPLALVFLIAHHQMK